MSANETGQGRLSLTDSQAGTPPVRAREAILQLDYAWTYANCYECGRHLASAMNSDPYPDPKWHAWVDAPLVSRGVVHKPTGLPRYGPANRPGRKDPVRHARSVEDKGRIVTGALGGLSTRGDFYANCPTCDRGQVVRVSAMNRPWNTDVLEST